MTGQRDIGPRRGLGPAGPGEIGAAKALEMNEAQAVPADRNLRLSFRRHVVPLIFIV